MKMILLFALGTLVLAACQTSQSTQANPTGQAGAADEGRQAAPSQLNDTWALRQLNGKAIDKAQFPRRVPYFEVNLRDNHLTGSTGCNRFSGPFQVTSTTVKIGPLMSTKMACANGMSVETEFLTALQAADTYKLNGKNLTFMQGGTELMTLVKGD